jgi:hypothetical protein
MKEDLKIITLSQTYQVEVKEITEEETESKKEKFITRSFLVDAVSVTDVESKIVEYYQGITTSYKISSIKFSRIRDILG